MTNMKELLEEQRTADEGLKKAKKVYWTIITFLAIIGLGGIAAVAPEVLAIFAGIAAATFMVWIVYVFVSNMIDNGIL
jgi:membrane protein YqaA with SNARE-associated domain